MLPKIYRLTKKKDFDAVYQMGKSVRSGLLAGKYLPNGLANSRFGFVVSKKISNKAVVRNKIRRRLSASAAAILAGNKIVITPKDFVVVALSGIEKKEFSDIAQMLFFMLEKAC